MSVGLRARGFGPLEGHGVPTPGTQIGVKVITKRLLRLEVAQKQRLLAEDARRAIASPRACCAWTSCRERRNRTRRNRRERIDGGLGVGTARDRDADGLQDALRHLARLEPRAAGGVEVARLRASPELDRPPRADGVLTAGRRSSKCPIYCESGSQDWTRATPKSAQILGIADGWSRRCTPKVC